MKDPAVIHPEGAWSAGLTDAIRLRDNAARRTPTDDDRTTSTFPITPAAREALRIDRENVLRRHRVVTRRGQIVRERPA